MNRFYSFEQYYNEAKRNKWYGYFAFFCRFTLAVAWIISGIVKIKASCPSNAAFWQHNVSQAPMKDKYLLCACIQYFVEYLMPL